MYKQPESSLWQGRIDSEENLPSDRYHQKVQMLDLTGRIDTKDTRRHFAIIGFECDEGVRRNKGTIGAAEAPPSIKQALAKLPFPFFDSVNILDAGSVQCENQHMEEAQSALADVYKTLSLHNITPIILGGGHETVYGHYLGVRKAYGENASIGILNLDAHFDMRSYKETTSSGTMFKQILDQDNHTAYMPVGIQKHGNTIALFQRAEQYKCEYILEEEITSQSLSVSLEKIRCFCSANDHILLTLCMDVINVKDAPGVSAPSPFGLNAKIIRSFIQEALKQGNVVSFDICETNPKLDCDNRTVHLAALYVAEYIACSIEKARNSDFLLKGNKNAF
ncbi:formimidoylglutamase [Bacillus sp. 1P06AnD]|uniref:formimidoylglutamase n=1 Tax=Bacillus sp. 1P06AnD TaxID=3132208 RepID=UPI00399FDFB5